MHPEQPPLLCHRSYIPFQEYLILRPSVETLAPENRAQYHRHMHATARYLQDRHAHDDHPHPTRTPSPPLPPSLHGRPQNLETLDPSTLTPLTPEVISRQATINIGTIGHVAHGKSTVVKAISGVQVRVFSERCATCPRGGAYTSDRLFAFRITPHAYTRVAAVCLLCLVSSVTGVNGGRNFVLC